MGCSLRNAKLKSLLYFKKHIVAAWFDRLINEPSNEWVHLRGRTVSTNEPKRFSKPITYHAIRMMTVKSSIYKSVDELPVTVNYGE